MVDVASLVLKLPGVLTVMEPVLRVWQGGRLLCGRLADIARALEFTSNTNAGNVRERGKLCRGRKWLYLFLQVNEKCKKNLVR